MTGVQTCALPISGDPPQLVASNRALVETLDWTPAHADIHQIISDALAWERKLADGIPT